MFEAQFSNNSQCYSSSGTAEESNSRKTKPHHAVTEAGQLTANFVTKFETSGFVTVILSQSEGLGKMALGIVKHSYDCSSQLISAFGSRLVSWTPL